MEHKVVIFKYGEDYKIAGGQVAVKKGDTVEFCNSTGAPVEVAADKVQTELGKFELKHGRMLSKTLDVPGWYEYTVTVTVIEDKKEKKFNAEASKPIVIVYP